MTTLAALYSTLGINQSATIGAIGTQNGSSGGNTFAAMLAQALDPSQAQNAGQTVTTSTQASGSGQNSAATDMANLQQALSSGNLSAAQLAFQALQTDLQGTQTTTQAHHHHHHHHSMGQEASATGSQTSTDTASGTPATTGTQAASTVSTQTSNAQLLSLLMS